MNKYIGKGILLATDLMAFDVFTVGSIFFHGEDEGFGGYEFEAKKPYGYDCYDIREEDFMLLHIGHINKRAGVQIGVVCKA